MVRCFKSREEGAHATGLWIDCIGDVLTDVRVELTVVVIFESEAVAHAVKKAAVCLAEFLALFHRFDRRLAEHLDVRAGAHAFFLRPLVHFGFGHGDCKLGSANALAACHRGAIARQKSGLGTLDGAAAGCNVKPDYVGDVNNCVGAVNVARD